MNKPSRRERERDRRRGEILDAAASVFAARGYGGATMDDVAAAAELSKGTLYLYFENKEALFLSLASRVIDQVVARFAEIRARGGDPIESLRSMLAAYAEIVTANEGKFRIMVGWLASNPTVDIDTQAFRDHRARVDSIVGHWVDALERGKQTGQVRPDLDSYETAARLWGSMIGMLLIALNFDELNRRFPHPISQSALIPGFIDLITRGLGPDSI